MRHLTLTEMVIAIANLSPTVSPSFTIYTAQRGRASIPEHLHFVDITVKSGISAFAPTWEMVHGVKNGSLSQQAYTDQYLAMMTLSQRVHSQIWNSVLSRPEVVLACYCAGGRFCHRHLLVDILTDYAYEQGVQEVHRGGELTTR